MRARFAGELAEQFGSAASPEEIEIAADRRARIEVIDDWLDRRGVVADKRSGRPREILAALERSQAALERQLTGWRRRGGGAGRGPQSDQRLELSAAEKVGLMSSITRRVLSSVSGSASRRSRFGTSLAASRTIPRAVRSLIRRSPPLAIRARSTGW